MAELMTLTVTEPGLYVEGRTQSWRVIWKVDMPEPLTGVFGVCNERLFVVRDQLSGVVDFLRVLQPRDLPLESTGELRRIDELDLYFHSQITAQEAVEACLVDMQNLLSTHLEAKITMTESVDTLSEQDPGAPLAPLSEEPGVIVLDYRGERITMSWSMEQEVDDPGYWRTDLEVTENSMGDEELFVVNDPLDIFFGTASPSTEDGSPILPEVNDTGEGRLSYIRVRHLAMSDAREAVSGVANDLLEYLRSKVVFRDNMTAQTTYTFWSEA